MAAERLLAILELLARADGANHPKSLCTTAAEITGLTGAGITLLSEGPNYTAYCASDAPAHRLLDIEVTLGEGPGVEACRANVALEHDDLREDTPERWVAYAPAALALGARAVFGFPVGIGAVRIGALILYRDAPGPLDDSQESDAYLMASVVGRAVLASRAGASRTELTTELALALTYDFSVHQAAGMVAVQGKMSLGDAMVALRAHAFGTGTSMTEMAESVVRRETAFEPTTGTWVSER
jgi:hypothetical protein